MRRLVAAVLALLGVLAGLLVQAAPAQAYGGAPWFEPGKPYAQNFPDPDVLRVGDRFYAYATATGGAYLPVSSSTDLHTWTARPAYDPGAPLNRDPWFNDALPYPAAWGADVNGGRMTKQVWAPGVERFGDRYVAFYSVRISASPPRYCISRATSSSPQGPFVDRSSGPLMCDADPAGSIDPEPFVDPATGTPYLLWKSEGRVGSTPTKLWIRQLTPDGGTFAPGSIGRELLRTSQGWEGNLIESPSMVRHNGQLYLFYSANEWASGAYATGYAVCASVDGPCSKPRGTPLLASSGSRLGPGGPTAFVDAQNRLRLAFHYWNAPFTSYPAFPACQSSGSCASQGQRRMAITELHAGPGGLQVGAGAAPAPAPAPAAPPPAPRPAPVPVATTAACPAGQVPVGRFADVAPADVHRPAVDCVAWWQVAAGSGGGQYQPKAGVTRGQMATFLARAIERSGGRLPEPRDAFVDDRASVHQDAINRLAAAGVVTGVDKRHYAPDRLVTREQLATLLVRALRYRTGDTPKATRDWFVDDAGSPHEGAINAAASSGLASGTGGGAYSPTATVRRDQMASFLARLLTLYVADGARTP